MSHSAPIYTAANCRFVTDIQWGVSLFWRQPMPDPLPLDTLSASLARDGIIVESHRTAGPRTSQFALTSDPAVSPKTIVQRLKGRLQYAIRDTHPKPFKRNFALRSYGRVTREVVERYVASQLDHHVMADPRVQDRLRKFQIFQPDVDLSRRQYTSHGIYWYNLHVVLAHRDRWVSVDEEKLRRVRDMMLRISAAKRFGLSRGGILADHHHLTLGCPFDVSPSDVALCFLNNLAFVYDMRPVFQYGAFIGTFGEYDLRVVT